MKNNALLCTAMMDAAHRIARGKLNPLGVQIIEAAHCNKGFRIDIQLQFEEMHDKYYPNYIKRKRSDEHYEASFYHSNEIRIMALFSPEEGIEAGILDGLETTKPISVIESFTVS